MEIRNFWIDIENASGVRQGTGPLRARFFDISSLLSASGEFSFEVSVADPNLSALAEKRVAICRYVDRNGALQVLGDGIIDKIVTTVAVDGSIVMAISGNDLGRELNYRSVGALNLAGVAAAGVTNGPDQIIALAPSGWTLEDGTTLATFYGGFDGESVLNALTRLGKTVGEHWRIESGRVVQWLGPASSFAASGIRAVQHVNDPVAIEAVDEIAVITGLKEESDTADLISRVIPRGSGNGGAITTLEFCTDAAPVGYTLNIPGNYLKHDAAETVYGRIERPVNFKELGPLSNTTADIQAAANMLLKAATEYLRGNYAPQKFYDLSLAHVNQILLPGTTIHVVYRELLDGVVTYDLNDNFLIVKTENHIDATGFHTTGVTVSMIDRLPISDNAFLASQVQESRILSVHQQLGASVDTLTWRDEMDDDHAANFRFWLGDEYTSIPRALLRFQIKPLRSTVKSVGSESATTSSGGSSTPTSNDSGAHQHSYFVPSTPYNGYTDNVTSHNHSVAIPAHTHTVTPVIDMVYGIFEEAGANTLVLANLVIKLNGGSDLVAGVTDIGNGWYELDITDVLVDEVFRPAQENNVIEISTATAKTARIEAQLTIRAVVQAVYYE